MVRNYKKKNHVLRWNDGQLHLAIESVLNGKSCKAAAAEFGIPRSTLQKKMKEKYSTEDKEISKKTPGFNRVFNDDQEQAIENYIIYMQDRFIGLSSKDVKKLAFDLAVKWGVAHNFNTKKRIAGKDWLKSFMDRHNLSNRKPEPTSAARIHGFNETAVTEFFTLLKSELDKHHFKPENIYNVDETGISIVAKTSPRIIGKKGQKQIGGKCSAERGETVTAEICMSATGSYMPPMLIFPRVKENKDLLYDAPPGAWAEFHKTGYMQSEIFVKWFQRFIKYSHASLENPVLLLLDGHATHVKNLKIIELAMENNISIISFPPHCTHRMQPLDVGFMSPLNRYFGEEVALLHRQNQRVTLKNIFSIFGKAFIKAAKMETAVNAFKKCGIYPCNPSVFSSSDFLSPTREESFSSLNDSLSENINTNVSKYQKDIQEVMDFSNKNTTHCQQSSSNKNNILDQNHFNNVNNEIKIPISYIEQAKPLLNLLSSCLALTPTSQSTSFQEFLTYQHQAEATTFPIQEPFHTHKR